MFVCLFQQCLIFPFVEFPVAPEISQPPKNATKVEGQDVVFSCSVDGNPSPVVTWTNNGEELNVAAYSRISVSSTNDNHECSQIRRRKMWLVTVLTASGGLPG